MGFTHKWVDANYVISNYSRPRPVNYSKHHIYLMFNILTYFGEYVHNIVRVLI